MIAGPELLLIGAVAGVGVLHTIVPDHWVPITLIARQRGWSTRETAWASLQAGVGHVLSTLLIAAVVWLAGIAVAARFGHIIDTAASIALVAFGSWIAFSAWGELRGRHGHSHGHRHGHSHGHSHSHAFSHFDASPEADPGFVEHTHHHGAHGHDDAPDPDDDPLYAPLHGDTAVLTCHRHVHRHGQGMPHAHWHDHWAETSHVVTDDFAAAPPPHEHRHRTTARTALLLILGSSPMVEGIPAFFAAGQFGFGLIIAMSVVFALSTIATYMILCVSSTAGLQRLRLGPFERYGEVMSGAFIAVIGIAFWIWPVL